LEIGETLRPPGEMGIAIAALERTTDPGAGGQDIELLSGEGAAAEVVDIDVVDGGGIGDITGSRQNGSEGILEPPHAIAAGSQAGIEPFASPTDGAGRDDRGVGSGVVHASFALVSGGGDDNHASGDSIVNGIFFHLSQLAATKAHVYDHGLVSGIGKFRDIVDAGGDHFIGTEVSDLGRDAGAALRKRRNLIVSENLHGNNRDVRSDALNIDRRKRIARGEVSVAAIVVAKNGASDVSSVAGAIRADETALIQLTHGGVDLASVVMSFESDRLEEASAEFGGDSGGGEIVAPVGNEAGVENGHVNAFSGLGDVFAIDHIGVPGGEGAGELFLFLSKTKTGDTRDSEKQN